MEDYKSWLNVSGALDVRHRDSMNNNTEFSFCRFPFILNAGIKAHVLQHESQMTQFQSRREHYRNLLLGNIEGGYPYFVLRIQRENIIQDTLSEISQHESEDLRKELKVQFVGEEGIDEGGVKKEWFQLVVKNIFTPDYGMFTLNTSNNSNNLFWFNGDSTDVVEFELIGMLLGLAIYNSVILDIHFPKFVYKKLADPSCKGTLEDLMEIDGDLAKGLQRLLDYKETDDEDSKTEEIFGATFKIAYSTLFGVQYHDLIENGGEVPVTQANKDVYVDLYCEFLLEKYPKRVFNEFAKGFRKVCMSRSLKLFKAEELELLICGSSELDFHALESGTHYEGGYTKNSECVKNFWDIVHEKFSVEQKKRLLFFSTGSDRAPIGGLQKLSLVIVRSGPDSDRLPSAHTCFNHLLIPDYTSKDKLEKCLLAAIENSEGFGML
eukprot:TRINITY_DN18842_c0_g1_i2.p1 TRINITY_DN18842_c0_g1~~TRINITY_DN18842_c0_g1_i2.p1  ORF type:complete len:436 (+),score=82.30 TRINITY_DN18842_c0_g1_i2:165-1472(+)